MIPDYYMKTAIYTQISHHVLLDIKYMSFFITYQEDKTTTTDIVDYLFIIGLWFSLKILF